MAVNGPHLLDGRVTHIVDPSNFFLRLGQDEHLKSFNEFEKDLISYCQHAPVGQAENIDVGGSVIAKSCKKTRRGENQWRRATVLRVDRDNNKYDVYYVDYGNSENVAARNIISALPLNILHFPCICVPCSLAGIKPLADSWTFRGTKIFEQLVKGKKFKVIILPYNQDRMHRTVAMYYRNNQRSIVHELLEAEVGKPTGEDVKAHLNDIPSDYFTRDTGAGNQTTVGFETLSAPGMLLVDLHSHAESFAANMLGCHIDHNLQLTEIYHAQNYESETVSLSSHNTSQLGELTIPAYENVLQHPAGVVKNSVFEADLSKEVKDKDNDVLHFEADIGEDFDSVKGRVTCCSKPDSVESPAFTEQSEYSLVSAQLENTGNSACLADSPVSPEDVIVPSFNLSALKQGAMSVEEMQEKQDAADMAWRKAQLQRDLDACHSHLEEESACVVDVSSHMQKESLSSTDIYDRISQEIHSVHNSSATISNVCAPVYEDQQTEGDHEEKGVLQDIASSEDDVCKDKSINKAEECKPDSPLPQIQKLDVAGEKYILSEEEEYQLQKEYRMILHEIKHGEDFEVVRAKLYSLVPIEGEPDNDHVCALVEVLVEEAVKNRELTDIAVEILTSYTNVLNGPNLLKILRHSAEKYVKLQLTKSVEYHVQFASLLAKIVTASCCWPSSLRNEVLDFAKQCLEKWIIFNGKGTQTGAIPKQLEAMYVACAESFLPQTFYKLQEDEEYMNFILHEMRGKVLKCEVNYVVRSRLLELLLQVAGSCPWSPASSEGHSNQAPVPAVIQETAVPEMLEKATQTEMSVSTSCSSSASSLMQEQASQTGVAPVVSHDFWLDSFVVSPVSSCSSVNDHNDSMASEETDSNSGRAKDLRSHSELATGGKRKKTLTSHGRVQRCQVLMEHLQGKQSTTSLSNNPYLAPSTSTCLGASFHENNEPSPVLMSIRQKTEEMVTQDMLVSSVERKMFDFCDGQLHDMLPVLVENTNLQVDKKDLPHEQILMLSPSNKECSTVLQQPSAQASPNVVANSSCQSKSAFTSTSSHLGFADDDFPLHHADTAHPLKEFLRSESPSQKKNSFKSIVSDIFGKAASEMQQQSDSAVTPAKSSTMGEKDISVVDMPFSVSSENIRTVDAYQNDSQSVASVNKQPTTWIVSPNETMEPVAGCKELNAQDSVGENKYHLTPPEYLLGGTGDMGMADKQATQGSLQKGVGDAWLMIMAYGCDDTDVRDSDSDDLRDDVLGEAGKTFATVPEESKEMEMDFSCKQTDSTSVLSPSCGTDLLPSAAEPYPGECQPHQTHERKRSASSEVDDRAAVETSSCELDVLIQPLYKKNDLAKYSSDGKTQPKKKKTKFRPLHLSSKPCEEVPSLTKWIPGEVICTNCGAKGHLRYECSEPCQSILL